MLYIYESLNTFVGKHCLGEYVMFIKKWWDGIYNYYFQGFEAFIISLLHISLNTLLILLKGVIMSQDVMYVVDFGDDFVLYYGTMRDCEQVVDESYGGLLITSYHNLTVAMKAQVGIDSA